MKKLTKTALRILSSVLLVSVLWQCQTQKVEEQSNNLAILATASGSMYFGRYEGLMNDGETPTDSLRWRSRRNIEPRPATTQWIQYEWNEPASINEINLFLWDYYGELPLPESYRVEFWNGDNFEEVKNPSGYGKSSGVYNSTTFDPVVTKKLRVIVDSAQFFVSKVMEWQVLKSPDSPAIPPIVNAGGDRSVVFGGKTYLSGSFKTLASKSVPKWIKVKGPGKVSFDNQDSLQTSASFSKVGDYEIALQIKEGKLKSQSSIKVRVTDLPPEQRLDVVYTQNYSIDNPMWNDRAKALVTRWIPWCIEQIERTDLPTGQGGLDNFIEAAKALRGEPHGKHLGYVFSNAWVHQTIESMCIALMLDPQADEEIMTAQDLMKKTLEKWIPIILAAQEPDGYLQTAYTLRDTTRWKERWDERNRSTHEGYVAGYFIESAINHYTLTDGQDTRLYDAAKKLSDCWVNNIGPGKKAWYDGHQEMEQALVRFGRFVNDMEGNGKGDDYIALAKFLLDNRNNGSEYDQSHVPVQLQYEAVGHAVRAVYNYSAMADVAAETADIDYQSAVMSLWDNMVNKKYYVTGGVGSGETSEGFGGNYSLPHDAYCESCSSCGLIFFQYKMNLAYHDAKYADLYEETMYNALLGSIDLEGESFYYTNTLNDNRERSTWHVCPCCVGNIPRTLLMIPTWTYVKSNEGIFVNLFIGGKVKVDRVLGTDVEMVQQTDYPWDGNVMITVNPKVEKEFSVNIRVPNHNTSELYTSDPEVSGLLSLTVNNKNLDVSPINGYVEIRRLWKAGDVIKFEIPMKIQKISSDEKIDANKNLVALRYGPLIYAVEKADQPDIDQAIGNAPLLTSWQPELLNGVMAIKGEWADGSTLTAIPYWTRNNRLELYNQNERRAMRVWLNK